MECNGWVKIHRTILEKEWVSDSDYFSLWVRLLLMANHKDKYMKIGNKKVLVKRGQLLTGLDALSRKVALNRSKLRRILNYFESDTQIDTQITNKYRIITITNYDTYQKNDKQSDTQTTIKRQSNGSKQECIKNDKNVKKKYVGQARQVISYLNLKSGKKFRLDTGGQIKYIIARLKEGFKAKDFETVVDYAINNDWFKENPKFIRPSTLFNSEKFETYLNDAGSSNPEERSKRRIERLRVISQNMENDYA